jgi:hypothetical protein
MLASNSRCWSARVVLLVLVGAVVAMSGRAGADHFRRARLQHDPREILALVARQMDVALRADEPLPVILLESCTPLARFQDAVEPQWRFRPPKFTNVYVVARNEIYLTDAAGNYQRAGRSLDESLAHEFAHYLQMHYQGGGLDDEVAEQQAIRVQFAFRDATRA